MENLKNRFKDAEWFEYLKDKSAIVGGAGGIGSHTVFSLSRILDKVMVFDFDTVEDHNLGGQLFGKSDIGDFKVTALKKRVLDLSATEIYTMNRKYCKDTIASDIMISAFDSMEARQIFFENWYEHAKQLDFKDCVFIDGRMLAEFGVIYTIYNEDGAKKYRENNLYIKIEDEGPCSYKSTTFSAQLISGLITSNLCNWGANVANGEETYSTPYKLTYLLQHHFFEKENLYDKTEKYNR